MVNRDQIARELETWGDVWATLGLVVLGGSLIAALAGAEPLLVVWGVAGLLGGFWLRTLARWGAAVLLR